MALLSEAQAGFCKDYSTSDHIFTLKSLIDIYLYKNKRLYCAFIDYKKPLIVLIEQPSGLNCSLTI